MGKSPEAGFPGQDAASNGSGAFGPGSENVTPMRSKVVSLPTEDGKIPRRVVSTDVNHPSVSVSVNSDVQAAKSYFRNLLVLEQSDDPDVKAENRNARGELLREARETDPEFHAARETLINAARTKHQKRVTRQGPDAHEYFSTFGQILRAEPDETARRSFAESEKAGDEYKLARLALQNNEHAGATDLQDNPSGEAAVDVVILSEPARESDATPIIEQDPNLKIQQDITWAHQVLTEYAAFPAESAEVDPQVLNKKEYAESAVADIWKDPQRLETALRVWKAQSGTEDFYDRAKRIVTEDVRFHWRDVTPAQLAEYTKINSREGYVAEDFGDVLQQYFDGPSTMEQRIDAYYAFADAAVDLVDDPEAVRRAALIGSYETDILPRNSSYIADMYLVHLAGFYDTEMQNKARVAGSTVIPGLTRIAGLDYAAIKGANERQFSIVMKDNSRKRQMQEMIAHSIAVNPTDYFKIKNDIVPEMNEVLGGPTDVQDVYRKITSETRTTELNSYAKIMGRFMDMVGDDALHRKYMEKVHSRAVGGLHRMVSSEEVRNKGEVPTFISIRVPGTDCVMELCIPKAVLGHRSQLIREYGSNTDAIDRVSSTQTSFIHQSIVIAGKEVFIWYRRTDIAEAERHEIDALNAIGFPEVAAEDVTVDNTELARKIDLEKRRFSNTRGFRVPFKHPALTALGYDYVTFRKDPEKLRSMDVIIHVEGMDVAVKLDKDFRLDLDGKQADISSIGPSLQNVLLSILYPALCAVHAEDERGGQVEIAKLLSSRVGYIGFIRDGYNFTPDQAKYLLRDEGEDLATISEQRKVDGETRNSTYTRPKEADDPTLPPVTIHIPLAEDLFESTGEIPQSEATFTRPAIEAPQSHAHPLGLTENQTRLQSGENPYRTLKEDIGRMDGVRKYIASKRKRLTSALAEAERSSGPTESIRRELEELFDYELEVAEAVQIVEESTRAEFDGTPQARAFNYGTRQGLDLNTILDIMATAHDAEHPQSPENPSSTVT